MAEGGVQSEDYLKFVAEESGNAAMDGNFSIQAGTKLVEMNERSRYPPLCT